MTELTLFDRPHSHTSDPQTSFDAGEKMVQSGELSRQEEEVHQALCYYDQPEGLTAKELLLDYFMVQRRISGLIDKGKVEFLLQDGTWTKYPKGKKLAVRGGCRIMRAI